MKINFSVIGTNKITDRFLAAAAEVEDFCLKGVYSRTMERAETYGKSMEQKYILTVSRNLLRVLKSMRCTLPVPIAIMHLRQ